MTLPLSALRERVPGVEGRSVVPIGDGWDFDVFLVDGEWIVRIARRPPVAARMRAEVALLPVLAPTLPVPVPHFDAVGPGWAAYRRIAGVPIGTGANAVEVARFLTALHGFDVARARSLGVEAADWRDAMTDELDEFVWRVVPLLPGGERRLAERRLREYLDDDASFDFRPAVVHADLGPEHVLCGPDGHLAGVIDWTDVRIGDPALDFAWLLHGLGARFAAELLAAYAKADATLPRRAAFYHLLGPWHEVTYGLDRQLPQYVESGLAGISTRLR